MKQLLVLIFITLTFVSQGQTDSYQDIDFDEIVEIKGLLYFKPDTTLVTGRVIRYNRKGKAKRYIMVYKGKPDVLGWNNFNDKYERPKESPLGNLVSATLVTTGVAMALSSNDINNPAPIINSNNPNYSITNSGVSNLMEYNKDIASKAQNDMSKTNEITQNLESNYNSDIIVEPKQGLYKKFFEDDQATIKKEHINRKKTGEWKRFYTNGILESTGIFIKGKKEGLWEEYHGNGQLKSKGYYIKDKKDGLWEEYFYNGQLKSKINFNEGKEDGLMEVFHENGKLLMRGSFENGIQIGEWNYYNENGVLFKTENFDN